MNYGQKAIKKMKTKNDGPRLLSVVYCSLSIVISLLSFIVYCLSFIVHRSSFQKEVL